MDKVHIIFDIGIKKDIVKNDIVSIQKKKKNSIYSVHLVVILFHFMSTAQNIRFLYQ